MRTDWAERLRAGDLCRDLPPATLAALLAAGQSLSFAAGQRLIAAGQPAERLHFLLAGSAEARLVLDSGRAVPMAVFGVGDCFGEMSMLTGQTTSADVFALTDGETLTLDQPAFEQLVAAHPQLVREFVRVLSDRLRRTDESVGAASELVEQLAEFLTATERGRLLRGRDARTRALQRDLAAQQASERPVLIVGERGTGKEEVARCLHFDGPTRHGPLLRVDCARLKATPWGDPLFGSYRQGGSGPAVKTSYLELAHGGSLLLKNIELLPATLQHRLAVLLAQGPAGAGARLLATSRHSLDWLRQAGRLAPQLAKELAPALLEVPALRERRRDIPELAQDLLATHAARYGKPLRGFSAEALNLLVSHDYTEGNLRELAATVERASLLSPGETVEAEAVFLRAVPATRSAGWNLLKLPGVSQAWLLRLFPGGLRLVTSAIFLFVVCDCLWGAADPRRNLGLCLGWQLWWPLTFVSFFLAGRAWCAVCPMAGAGLLAQRWYNAGWRVPAWLKRNDAYVGMAGFFAIVWLEAFTDMRADPRATGWLLLAITLGAVVSGVLYPRRSWCHHLCPLGGLAGASATGSLLEVRPTIDVCTAQCTSHRCYLGDAHGLGGCPTHQHLMFVDSNQHCLMCLDCLRACEHGSPQLNVRLPGRELWTMAAVPHGLALFVAMLAGLLPVLVFHSTVPAVDGWLRPLLAHHRLLGLTGLLTFAAVLPLYLAARCRQRLVARKVAGGEQHFTALVAAWLPLVGAAFAAYQAHFLPGAAQFHASVRASGPRGLGTPLTTFPLVLLLQLVLVGTGWLVSLVTLAQRNRLARPDAPVPWCLRGRLHALALSAYAVFVTLGMALAWTSG